MQNVFREDLFAGDHVFVAGGSSGVGLGVARRFGQRGANVSLLGRDEEKLRDAAQELEEDVGCRVEYHSADVRDYGRLEDVFEEAARTVGGLDVLVCAAAGNFPAFASELSANAFGSVVDIDLKGTFNTCRAAYDHFPSSGGSIVAISAPQSEQPMPMQSHAGAAKAGVDNLVRNLALEWGNDGIRANAIQPGPVEDTEGLRRLLPDDETRDRLAEALPSGRFVRADEIGSLCLYLSSPLAESITGAVIPVDGGQMTVGSGALVEVLRDRED